MESPAFWLHDPLVAVGLDPPIFFAAAPAIPTNVREVDTPADLDSPTLTRRQEAAETSNKNRPCHEPRTEALATTSSSSSQTCLVVPCTSTSRKDGINNPHRRRREGCDRGRSRTQGRQMDHPCRAHTPRTNPTRSVPDQVEATRFLPLDSSHRSVPVRLMLLSCQRRRVAVSCWPTHCPSTVDPLCQAFPAVLDVSKRWVVVRFVRRLRGFLAFACYTTAHPPPRRITTALHFVGKLICEELGGARVLVGGTTERRTD
jgi:hypothetical protein